MRRFKFEAKLVLKKICLAEHECMNSPSFNKSDRPCMQEMSFPSPNTFPHFP